MAAQANGEILNYSNISRDVGVDDNTIKSYFQILEDTLLGFFLEPYHKSVRKRQVKSPRFYLFDTGVKKALQKTLTSQILPNTYAYGKAFEHFVIAEFFRLNDYFRKECSFYFLTTKDGAEIDLVVEGPGSKTTLVEIKSTRKVDDRDTKVLESFSDAFKKSDKFCLSQDDSELKIGSVHCLPWHKGIKEILEI